MIAVLSGGVGAARLLRGMVRAVPAEQVTAVVNVGDDLELHGLHVSPDLDTVTYTVAEATDPERGWGLADETWRVMDALDRYPGAPSWFRLGDRDMATHLFRTHRLRQGVPCRSSRPRSPRLGGCHCACCRPPTTGSARSSALWVRAS